MHNSRPNLAAFLAAAAMLIAPVTVVDARAPSAAPAAAKRVMLCGYVVNPTPANWWLTDRIGDWTIMTQGAGDGPEGMDLIPDLSEKQWVKTNGSYGYGCGCMSATVDRKNMKILRIHSFKQKTLATCRADKKVPRPEG